VGCGGKEEHSPGLNPFRRNLGKHSFTTYKEVEGEGRKKEGPDLGGRRLVCGGLGKARIQRETERKEQKPV